MKQRLYDDDEPSDAQELLSLSGSARSSQESLRGPWTEASLKHRHPRWASLGKKNRGLWVCVGLAIIVALAVGGGSYHWWSGPERWASPGWYPSRKFSLEPQYGAREKAY